MLWLDLANTYGSIPHKMIDLTLDEYLVPERVRELMQHYFDKFVRRFTVADYTTT